MQLHNIRIEGVRNLADGEINFDTHVNYLFGDNGAGKTSILEAIHFLAVGRSFRTNRDNEILKYDAPYLKISAKVNDNNEETEAEIRLADGVKTAFLNQQKQDKLSSYLGWLPVVTILLADIDLVSGPPDRRRNFIDLAISKINKFYLRNLIEYRAVLMQRNKLLQGTQNVVEEAHYEAWESAIAKYGNEIYAERRKIIPSLLADAQKFYSVFMENRKIIFEYKINLDTFESNITNHEEKFLNLLKNNREKDQELGHTTIGPHRDDIIIKEESLAQIAGSYRAVRKFGSEGEQRLAALSLKLAEAELLAKNNRRPIFLLDEVASELDANNTKKLFELIKGQFIYATAKEFKNIINRNGKIFYVEKGKITKTETSG
jgi:DNA replication and repair protein RecF